MSDDEFDNIPDDFADMNGVDWGYLLGTPSRGEQGQILTEVAQPVTVEQAEPSPSSSGYFGEDVMDSSFLAELDAVEQRIALDHQAGPSRLSNFGSGNRVQPSSHADASLTNAGLQTHSYAANGLQSSRFFPNETSRQARSSHAQSACSISNEERISTSISKRPRSESWSSCSPNKKGKTKAIEGGIEQLLKDFEDEFLCPVCCDIIVAAQVGNPCGHSFCGDCGWQWIVVTKKKGCPICRTELSRSLRMIPNISLDNTIEKYIKVLGSAGDADWDQGGKYYNEWIARKEKWKMEANARVKKIRRQASRNAAIIDLTWFENDPVGMVSSWVDYDDDADPTYEDEVEGGELIPVAPRTRQFRRGRR